MYKLNCPSLYLITDRHLSPVPLPTRVEAAISAVDPKRVAVQLREKDLSSRELLDLARALLAVCARRGVPLLINDRVDLAIAIGAQGVHLGGGSLPATSARQLLGPGALIAVSAHSANEVRERREGADFGTWGPFFHTPSKAVYGAPVGAGHVQEALSMGLPLVALGGIDKTNITNLRQHGFSGVACIRAVFAAQDPGAEASSMLDAFLVSAS